MLTGWPVLEYKCWGDKDEMLPSSATEVKVKCNFIYWLIEDVLKLFNWQFCDIKELLILGGIMALHLF